jgi:hypothetical protein
LKKGRERFSGTVAEFAGTAETRLRTRDAGASERALAGAGFAVTRSEDDLVVATDDVPAVARLVVEHGILHLARGEPNLEARYLALVEEGA